MQSLNPKTSLLVCHLKYLSLKYFLVSSFPFTIALLTLLSVLNLNTIWANDASYLGDGASIYLVKNEQISMISEVIDIRYQTQKDPRRWTANCLFRFQNHSQTTVKVLMGFPDWHSYSENTSDPWAIKNFSVKIKKKNGEIIQVQPIHQIISQHLTKAVRPDTAYQTKTLEPHKTHLYLPVLAQGQEVFFEGAWLWSVEFEAQEIIEIENHFAFGGFNSNGPISDWLVKSKSPKKMNDIPKDWAFWVNLAKAKASASTKANANVNAHPLDYGNSAFELIHYILTTGLTWKNAKIQDSRISIQIPPHTFSHEWLATPGFEVIKREDHYALMWHFQNFKPDFNLSFVRMFGIFSDDSDLAFPLFNDLNEAKAWIKIARKSKMHPDLIRQLYMAHIYAFTKQVDDPKWQAFFDQLPQSQGIVVRVVPRYIEEIVLALRLYLEEIEKI
jgi:hypothetical protein